MEILEMKSSVSQIKTPTKSLANRIEQVENRVSGTESKAEEQDHTVNNIEKH
jgi:hypothetical protein